MIKFDSDKNSVPDHLVYVNVNKLYPTNINNQYSNAYAVISDGEKQYEDKITYAFKVAGMKIKCEEKFVNRTKELSLLFTGKGKILDLEHTFVKEILINTEIYKSYDWTVKNGVLYVTLFEKINEKPPFFREKLAKNVKNKPDFTNETGISNDAQEDK